MRKIEFKNFLVNYKEVFNLIKNTFEKIYPGEKFEYFYLLGGKIMVVKSGKAIDFTKNIIDELLPDDLIF